MPPQTLFYYSYLLAKYSNLLSENNSEFQKLLFQSPFQQVMFALLHHDSIMKPDLKECCLWNKQNSHSCISNIIY